VEWAWVKGVPAKSVENMVSAICTFYTHEPDNDNRNQILSEFTHLMEINILYVHILFTIAVVPLMYRTA
jgi:hypothetical protein